MRPHVIVHMAMSIDGRIVTDHWPDEQRSKLSVYEEIHETLNTTAWLVGRVTMGQFSKGEPSPVEASASIARTNWRAPNAEAGSYAVAVDQSGKLHVNRSDISGDALIMILSEDVTDTHLAELRRDGISYIFAGREEIDLSAALATLYADFGIERLALEGGGGINGSFLAAGLVDEVSILILPLIDGGSQMPSIFERALPGGAAFSLQSTERLKGDVLHLRYAVI